MSTYIRNATQEVSDLWSVVKSPPYAQIDAKLSSVENILNKAGWIPGVSILSGTAREYLGYVELLMGAASGTMRNIAAKFSSSEEAKEKLYKQAEVDFSYCMNGLGNIVRGNVEKLPAWDVWAIGINKLILFSYDVVGLRFNYGHEVVSERDIPLLRSFNETQKV